MSRDALLIPMKIVTHLTSLSRATIYRRVAAGTFPKPINLGGRRVAISRDDLERWVANPRSYSANSEQGCRMMCRLLPPRYDLLPPLVDVGSRICLLVSHAERSTLVRPKSAAMSTT